MTLDNGRLVDAQGQSRTPVCRSCGALDSAVTEAPGSWRLEVVLWCLLAMPGLVYTAWRFARRRRRCGDCGSADLVPDDSPAGRLAAQTSLPSRGRETHARLGAVLLRLAPASGVVVVLALEVTLLFPAIGEEQWLRVTGGLALVIHILSLSGHLMARVLRALR